MKNGNTRTNTILHKLGLSERDGVGSAKRKPVRKEQLHKNRYKHHHISRRFQAVPGGSSQDSYSFGFDGIQVQLKAAMENGYGSAPSRAITLQVSALRIGRSGYFGSDSISLPLKLQTFKPICCHQIASPARSLSLDFMQCLHLLGTSVSSRQRYQASFKPKQPETLAMLGQPSAGAAGVLKSTAQQ